MMRSIWKTLCMVFLLAGMHVALATQAMPREDLEEEGVLRGYWPKAGQVMIDNRTFAVDPALSEILKGIPLGTRVYYGVRDGRVFGIVGQDRQLLQPIRR